jgi:tRNA(Ile)-lysidine synthase
MGPHPALARVRHAVRASLADLRAGDLVVVACSGGADSLALAAATAFEAPKSGLRAAGLTVDHGLQDGSAQRAAAVVGTLRALELDPVDAVRVTVGRHGGPEAAARTARYAALGAFADTHAAAAILLGHTADDQAETVLLGLARGSGARSLAGMAPVAGRYRRPLLDLPRADLAQACEAAGLTPWQDPHNADPAYTRARVRADALPALEKALGPGVAEARAPTARLVRADADALDQWAADAARTAGMDCLALAALPAAIRSRVLRAAALAAGAPAGALAQQHVAALDALVTQWHGQGPVHLPGGVEAARRCGILVLGHPSTID